MRPNRIHDALCLLDDDLIESVAALRARARKRKKRLLPLSALAACLCVALIGAFALHASLLSGTNQDRTSASTPESSELIGVDYKDGVFETSFYHTFSVRIDEWTESGFYGTVQNADGILESGATVIVSLNDNASLFCPDGSVLTYSSDRPNAANCGIPEGSVVTVTVSSYTDARDFDYAGDYYLEADSVALSDSFE